MRCVMTLFLNSLACDSLTDWTVLVLQNGIYKYVIILCFRSKPEDQGQSCSQNTVSYLLH
jgi:hypothetical protein